jgi:hypothetical protein
VAEKQKVEVADRSKKTFARRQTDEFILDTNARQSNVLEDA